MSSGCNLLKIYAIAFGAGYIALASVFAILKTLGDTPPSLTWPEVFYGPAITAGSCFLLLVLAYRIEHWIRGRA